ncbi:hypothetical protein NDU88_005287 [Pleurodeles waltl]|uniref:Uncharacterized protein n=1 Tax=Pleurodeles waltl TaxID=8319 RepID=A0AAV7M8W0_PLEWA|nr:hypothetical protein NDU88_005287 [Pleurodeles waltl]
MKAVAGRDAEQLSGLVDCGVGESALGPTAVSMRSAIFGRGEDPRGELKGASGLSVKGRRWGPKRWLARQRPKDFLPWPSFPSPITLKRASLKHRPQEVVEDQRHPECVEGKTAGE